MISIARRFNASLFKTWELTFEREDLLQALTHAHAHESALARTDALTAFDVSTDGLAAFYSWQQNHVLP